MVEFSLVLPIFLVIAMGVIEFSFAFNATLAANFASRDAALLAAEAGRASGADCVILKSVEDAISAPAERTRIQEVLIFRSNRAGTPIGGAASSYVRSGSKSCSYPDGTTLTVPYSASTSGYPEAQRCNQLDGCPGIATTLDTVGIRVTYDAQWRTPLQAVLRLVGGASSSSAGFTIIQTSTMRMEPVL